MTGPDRPRVVVLEDEALVLLNTIAMLEVCGGAPQLV
jgi:hypothetical protein